MFLISLVLLHSSVNKKFRGDTGYWISLVPISAQPTLMVVPPKRMPSGGMGVPRVPCLTPHLLNADMPNHRTANSLGKQSILDIQATTNLKSCQVPEFHRSILATTNGVSTLSTFLLHESCSPEKLSHKQPSPGNQLL